MSNVEITAWLLSAAGKLRAGTKDAVNVSELLNAHGVQIRFGVSNRRSGALGQSSNGEWFAVILGPNPTVDRFTAAHELGHFLLIKHWNYSPTINDKRSYYFCEELCNQFAAKLLIDYSAVSSLRINSSKACLGQTRDVATTYQVSLEAAARAIVNTHTGIGICAFEKITDGCFKRSWGVSSLNGISVRYGKKMLKCDSLCEEMRVWGAALMEAKFSRDDLDFATESNDARKVNIEANEKAVRFDSKTRAQRGLGGTRAELSAIMVNAGHSDRRNGLDC